MPVKRASVFPDEGHGFRNKQNQISAANAYLEFLDRYLNNPLKKLAITVNSHRRLRTEALQFATAHGPGFVDAMT